MGMTTWPDEDITILRKMLAEGKPSHEIGAVLGRKPSAVRRFVNYNKDRLRLVKPMIQGRGRFNQSQFDKDWYGVVPFGHWSITKPWGTKCDAEHVIKS